MRKVWLYCCFFSTSIFLAANTVVVPLPGLNGSLTEGESARTASFNCGINFTDIQNVQILCYGIQCPGSVLEVGTGKILPWNGYFKFTLPVTSELWYCNISPDAGLFIEEGVFNNSSPSSTWDFLLNGEADVKVRMPTTIIPAIYTKLTPASGNISDAQITINGTYESLELESNTHEYVLADSVYRIEWTDYRYYDMCPEDYLLYYSIDNGLNWTPITGTPVSNTCYYDWLVPEVTAENCLIKNEDANEILFDISNESFAIYECSSPPAGDYTSDCYINLSDFRIIASNWLETDGYTLSDLLSLCENWLNCSNALDPDCSL